MTRASSIGDSRYNGLVVTVTKRYGAGYSFQGSSHLSKSTSAAFLDDTLTSRLFDSPSDPQNLEVDRGRNDNDMRHARQRLHAAEFLHPGSPVVAQAPPIMFQLAMRFTF